MAKRLDGSRCRGLPALPSFTVCPQYINVTDRRTDRTGQRSDSTGRTVFRNGRPELQFQTVTAVYRVNRRHIGEISSRSVKTSLRYGELCFTHTCWYYRPVITCRWTPSVADCTSIMCVGVLSRRFFLRPGSMLKSNYFKEFETETPPSVDRPIIINHNPQFSKKNHFME